AVSSLPPIGGGRVGEASGVGVGVACFPRGAKYCNRSCEIHRYKISANRMAAIKTTSLRSVLTLATDYFFNQATIATTMPITLKIDISPAGITLFVRMNFGTNCAASKSETIRPMTRPAVRLAGRIQPATSK